MPELIDYINMGLGPAVASVATAILFGIYSRLRNFKKDIQTAIAENRTEIGDMRITLTMLIVTLRKEVPDFGTEWDRLHTVIQEAAHGETSK